jgi:uncharacterized Rmd1/YagE family protein
MPSVSRAQQAAAAIAEHHPEKAKGAAKQMAKSMTKTQLHHFAATPSKGLPKHAEKTASVGFLAGYMQKTATTYTNHNVQRYLPTQKRRELTPQEQTEIESRKNNLFEKFFPNLSDSPAVNMASPTKRAMALWAAAALYGAGVGGATSLAHSEGESALPGALKGAAIGGVLGIPAAALYAMHRDSLNKSIEENMRRIPRNGTIRDLQADPAWQAEEDRRRMMQAMMMRAAL